MIKLLRIDHRLLHGQVAFSWTSQLQANCILLASDSLVEDKFRISAIKLAKPDGIKVVAKSIDDAIIAINSGVTDRYNLFIVVESIIDADKLARALSLNEVNLGGTKPADNKRLLSKAVYATDEEIELLRGLIKDGIDVYCQMIPTEKRIETKTLI
ncbi:MAG: PTS sugar transporter subunit IIB [Erysipelotrichaceae bacterium]